MASAQYLSAAVIGLGQVGSRFDEEPREKIWSHAGAYIALPDAFKLIAGVDPVDENRVKFQNRVPNARTFGTLTDMLQACRPDVLSICTPPKGRKDIFETIFRHYAPRAIVCEKPLELSDAARQKIISLCDAHNVPLMVNYNRRYAPLYQSVKKFLKDGTAGDVMSITLTLPNRIWSMGTHGINMMLYMAGSPITDIRSLANPALHEEGEPAFDVICSFNNGMSGRLACAGMKEHLIFETDIFCTKGRVQISDQKGEAHFTPFQTSSRYVGYKELGIPELLFRQETNESTFVTLIHHLHALALKPMPLPNDGMEAMESENIINALMGPYPAKA